MTAGDLAQRLDATKSGSGWNARCPAHDDHRASLSISIGDDQRVLLFCHAQCSLQKILDALDLTAADLFPERTRPSEGRGPTGEIVATYPYRDAAGVVQYEVVRYSPKNFRQRRPDGAGGWIWKMTGVAPLVYRRDQLGKHPRILICEGEKDVDRLWTLNLPATCNSGGAGKWRDTHTQQLIAAGVKFAAIIPDGDGPGRLHADTVARSCHQAGIEVKVVPLPAKDASEFLDGGAVKTDLTALITGTETYTPRGLSAPTNPASATESAAVPVLVRLSDVAPESIDWLWPGRIARGKYTLLAGDPGLGKSTVTLDLAARLTRGLGWPDGAPAPAGPVLLLSAEDGLSDTIRPRVDRAGGDASLVHVLQSVKDERGVRPLNLARDLAALVSAIRTVRPVLVIVDPITAYLGKTDSYKDAEVRGLLAPILAELETAHTALLAIGHLSKDAQRAALHRPGGSIAFVAAARIVLCLAADPDEPDRRVLAGLKNNLAPTPESLAFRFADTGRLVWDAGTCSLNAETLLRPALTPGDRDSATTADGVIRDLLDDETWPLEAKRALEAGRAHGIPDRTLQGAAKRLGIRIKRLGFGPRGQWVWQRPPIDATIDATGASLPSVAPMASMGNQAHFGEREIIGARNSCTRTPEDDDVSY